MVKTKQKNPGWLDKLLKRYSEESVLAVGYPVGTSGVGTKYPDGTPVLLVAAVNNYGSQSRGIPARDFMNQGAVPAVEKTNPIKATLIPALNAGKISKEQILEHMGQPAADAFKDIILTGKYVENKAATIARKGSAQPLTNTGLLRQTLTYAVRKPE